MAAAGMAAAGLVGACFGGVAVFGPLAFLFFEIGSFFFEATLFLGDALEARVSTPSTSESLLCSFLSLGFTLSRAF